MEAVAFSGVGDFTFFYERLPDAFGRGTDYSRGRGPLKKTASGSDDHGRRLVGGAHFSHCTADVKVYGSRCQTQDHGNVRRRFALGGPFQDL